MSDIGVHPLVAAVRETKARLARTDLSPLSDGELVDLLRAAEELKATAAAAQARAARALVASTEAATEGSRQRDRLRRGVVAQVGLALRCSPHRAARVVGTAHALAEMPEVADALARGRTTEHRAFLAVRETAHLSRADRAQVDAELAARPGGLEALGDRGVEHAARAAADRIDPAGAVRRRSRAVSDRHVTLRPAPDGTTRLSALLPLADGVGVLATLRQHADAARATGDPRSRGQVMADELVARTTGRSPGTPATVEVSLVMTDASLLAAGSQEPATVPGHGPVPADLARGLVRDADRVWLRRLFTRPDTSRLVAMDSRARVFRGGLRRFLVVRDQVCRTPWCDAPVRHLDHVVPVEDGGPTTVANAQGLCEACNQAKSGGALTQQTSRNGAVVTTTATGHRYLSRPPPPPGAPRVDWSVLEHHLRDWADGLTSSPPPRG